MLDFPKSTEVKTILPKESFYKNLKLKPELKEKFVTDIKRIVLINKLSASTLNIQKGSGIIEILVLLIDLKKQDFDSKLIESIARQNTHKIVFLLRFENKVMPALFHGRIYKAGWVTEEALELKMQGLDLDKVWGNFVSQISGITVAPGQDLDERLETAERIEKLKRDIESLEKQARSEKQPKKKFEMVQELQLIKLELEALK